MKHGDAATLAAPPKCSPAKAVKRPRTPVALLGPAFIASIAMWTGNFATNIQGGPNSATPAVVVVCSNLMAMLVQSLSAKLGIATGRNLASSAACAFPGRWSG